MHTAITFIWPQFLERDSTQKMKKKKKTGMSMAKKKQNVFFFINARYFAQSRVMCVKQAHAHSGNGFMYFQFDY